MTYERNAFVMHNDPVKPEVAALIVLMVIASIMAVVMGVLAWTGHTIRELPPVTGQ